MNCKLFLQKNRFLVAWKQGILSLLFILVFAGAAFAQPVTLKGKITDETGLGLPGVNILVQGTVNGTITDIDGNYELRTEKGATLLVTFTGYRGQSVTVGNSTTIDIAMVPDAQVLGEVIVTGYSSQRKRDITGAVSVINADDLNQTSASSFTQKLEGRASGVNISTSGEPGEGTTVRIRGISSFQNNDPLYVIDGVPVQDSYSTGFNPNDIESIQVLKGCSCRLMYFPLQSRRD